MNEIKCPECGKPFKIDESGFAEIKKQVYGQEFEKELAERVRVMQKEKESAVKLAEAQAKAALEKESAKKNAEIIKLEAKINANEESKSLAIKEGVEKAKEDRDSLIRRISDLEAEVSAKTKEKESALKETRNELEKKLIQKETEVANLKSAREKEILELQTTIKSEEGEKQLSLRGDIATREAEIAELRAKIEAAEKEKESAVAIAKAAAEREADALQASIKSEEAEKQAALSGDIAKKEIEIARLEAEIKAAKEEKESALIIAKSNAERELGALEAKLREKENAIELVKVETKNEMQSEISTIERQRDELKIVLANEKEEKERIKNEYDLRIRDRDGEIERLKDMKLKLSTKMVGESLEQYCLDEFNKIRAAAFPNAFFGKDNAVIEGGKGDFIFRDPAEGVESISIMFDMKHENDDTITKQKNEKFFQKLDEDRRKKKCEYAILVSTLEADSDLYNQGIVDVSYRYPKMYVIRPQFFVPMITLLKNAAEKSLAMKNELAIIKSQNIDITTFEDDVNNWKAGWLTHMKNAGKKHGEAVEQINKAIKDLEKVRDALTTSDKHLLYAENKMDELEVKKLTRKNPTMATKFAELKK